MRILNGNFCLFRFEFDFPKLGLIWMLICFDFDVKVAQWNWIKVGLKVKKIASFKFFKQLQNHFPWNYIGKIQQKNEQSFLWMESFNSNGFAIEVEREKNKWFHVRWSFFFFFLNFWLQAESELHWKKKIKKDFPPLFFIFCEASFKYLSLIEWKYEVCSHLSKKYFFSNKHG